MTLCCFGELVQGCTFYQLNYDKHSIHTDSTPRYVNWMAYDHYLLTLTSEDRRVGEAGAGKVKSPPTPRDMQAKGQSLILMCLFCKLKGLVLP